MQKVSVLLPPEDWLCRKLENLNLVLIEGYPSKSIEPGGLHVDQSLRPPKSQSRWYGIHPAEPKDPTRPGKSVNSWPNDAAKLNSAFLRICKPSASASQPPSRPISQDTLRKWEKAAKETSYICSQLVLALQRFRTVCKKTSRPYKLNYPKASHQPKLKLR